MKQSEKETLFLGLAVGLVAGIAGTVWWLRRIVRSRHPVSAKEGALESAEGETEEGCSSAEEAPPAGNWLFPWALFSLGSLAVFAWYAFQLVFRYFRPDPDFLNYIATIAEWLSVLSISSLLVFLFGLRAQQERAFERWMAKVMADWRILSAISLFIFLLALGTVVWFYRLPIIARGWNDEGVHLLLAGRTSEAIQKLQVAVSLHPDYAQAHYNLAWAYEEFLDFERAIQEYQIALEKNASLDAAYNNLGRLYIVRKDYNGAIHILRKGEQRAQDDAARYAIYKNLGWAYYEKGLYTQAIEELERAIALQGDRAEPHYFLALTYEKLGEKGKAIQEWEFCLALAVNPEESELAVEARSHLERLRGRNE